MSKDKQAVKAFLNRVKGHQEHMSVLSGQRVENVVGTGINPPSLRSLQRRVKLFKTEHSRDRIHERYLEAQSIEIEYLKYAGEYSKEGFSESPPEDTFVDLEDSDRIHKI